MDLTHTFTVPAPVEETWDAFVAIEDVAGCFPGAAVTSVEGISEYTLPNGLRVLLFPDASKPTVTVNKTANTITVRGTPNIIPQESAARATRQISRSCSAPMAGTSWRVAGRTVARAFSPGSFSIGTSARRRPRFSVSRRAFTRSMTALAFSP